MLTRTQQDEVLRAVRIIVRTAKVNAKRVERHEMTKVSERDSAQRLLDRLRDQLKEL